MYVGVCYVPSLSKEKLFVDEAYVAEAYVAVNTRVSSSYLLSGVRVAGGT